MLDANRLILDELPEDVQGELIESSSKVEGRVVIGPALASSGPPSRGPAIIGAGTTIPTQYIGLYSAIATT